jgi:son of sevenless
MVVDDDVLEKEDLYILDRMKEFISNEEVIRLAAAKQLMIFIERAVSASATSYFPFS